MPPKQLPLASTAASNSAKATPTAASSATAAAVAVASAAASAAAKKSALKRKSSAGSTDSKTVKKKKTNVKAAKPGASAVKPPVVKPKDDKKTTAPKVAAKTPPSTGTAKSSKAASSKTASPSKSAGGKSKAKSSSSSPPQQSKLQKSQQVKRDIVHLDSIEHAFRQDREVWCPESSRGWMYRTGTAETGGRTYLDAVNGANNQHRNQGGMLFDETALLENALRYNNLTSSSLTPTAYASLLEQARRYALELLVDAQDYAVHASRTTVASLTPADLLLAAEMRGDVHGVPSTLPAFEEMAEYASRLNNKPLPPIPVDCYNGVALPPVEEQLTFRTFDVVNGARVVQKMMRGGELPLATVETGLMKRSSSVDSNAGRVAEEKEGAFSRRGSKTGGSDTKLPSYGATKGRQIAILLKTSGETSGAEVSTTTS